ncbi:MAG: aminopeptidase [Thermodesulfobacteriota bacterium]|nr:aminopeptidase [Thermodesulfobacteriota bacterium]
MFTPEQLKKYAEVLIWGLETSRGKKIKPGGTVLIQYDAPALKLAEILYGLLVRKRTLVVQRVNKTANMELDFFLEAGPKQLLFQVPGDLELYENLDGAIHLLAPKSLTHLKDIDPEWLHTAAQARKPLNDILERRERSGDYGRTLCVYPTREIARCAGLSLKDYAKQLIKACYLDKSDPVHEWKLTRKKIQAVLDWLNSMDVDSYHIESEKIDLVITPGERRKWIGLTGQNIPSFEVYLSPDWRGTKGVYFADLSSYRNGNLIQGIRLLFERGNVVKAGADVGGGVLRNQITTDKGAARLGEFSLTDTRFSRIDRFMAMTLLNENFGGGHGNCHVALGASLPEAYAGDPASLTEERKKELGLNSSSLHWDMINTEKKTVTARLSSGKKKIIYENGRFTY